MTGVAVPFENSVFEGGWLLDVADVLVHVKEAPAGPFGRDVGSDPPLPTPAPGTRVQVRGQLGLADGFVVDEIAPDLLPRAERSWRVDRIVRIPPSRPRSASAKPAFHDDVDAIDTRTNNAGYLLDLTREE